MLQRVAVLQSFLMAGSFILVNFNLNSLMGLVATVLDSQELLESCWASDETELAGVCWSPEGTLGESRRSQEDEEAGTCAWTCVRSFYPDPGSCPDEGRSGTPAAPT